MSLGRATQCSENKVSPRLRSRLDRDIQQPAIGSTSGPKALSRPLPGSAGQGEGPWAVGGAPALPSWNAAPSSLSRTGQRVRVASWVLAPGRRLGSSVPLRRRAGAGCQMAYRDLYAQDAGGGAGGARTATSCVRPSAAHSLPERLSRSHPLHPQGGRGRSALVARQRGGRWGAVEKRGRAPGPALSPVRQLHVAHDDGGSFADIAWKAKSRSPNPCAFHFSPGSFLN